MLVDLPELLKALGPMHAVSPDLTDARDFLRGGGEMGALMRAFDWTQTPLGAPESWPRSLKTAIRIMLTSRQPIWIGWGEDLIYFYNDPYQSIIGAKHPWALGRPTREVWREIWTDIGPMLAKALGGDEGTYVEAQLLIMERRGYREETYYTFSYSPIPDDDGSPGGIICANTDDTRRVIGERQLALLREVAAATAEARTVDQACERISLALATNPRDLPFAMLYRADPDGRDASRVARCNIAADHPAAPPTIALDSPVKWPLGDVIRDRNVRLVSDPSARFATDFPTGAWDDAVSHAAIVPIPVRGDTARAGVMIAGLNPYRLFDDDYRRFLDLVAGEIGAGIANAQAYEEERRRAEALAEIDRAKTTFFSNISHEFRTPLTLMLGPLEESLAGAARLGPQELARLEAVHRNGLRLLKLVNTLLDFSRMEAGRYQATYELLDLSQYTAELASNFRSVVERAGLDFVVNCPPLPHHVYVDRDMWEKIILNLLSNAFKFTFAGRIAVETRVSPAGTHVEAIVQDTGTGIADNELPHLFERFRRVEGARGRSIEGSGIGLALVEELVKLHGGNITVHSSEGVGTTFIISVPFGAEHLPHQEIGRTRGGGNTAIRAEAYVQEAAGWLRPAPQAGDELPPTAAVDAIGPYTAVPGAERQLVYVADDNADMRDYVGRLLRSAGFQVTAFGDGAELLEAVSRRVPDLVVSDVMMPRLDGFALVGELRANAAWRDVPILLLSARAGDDAKVEGLQSGADDYLTKPFSARELVARVQSTLEMARMRQESEQAIRDQATLLEQLNRVGNAVAAEVQLERTVQVVTDAATQLSRAAFGAFFYNVVDDRGEAYTLYALSGAPREAFERFPQPRNTHVFGPTFRGEAVVRSDDITLDPRYGKNPPYHGTPAGHLPVRSYLAAPVISHTGEVLGGLFFGHPDVGVFDERAERLVAGIALQAAIAIDKARLFQAAQSEIERRKKVETALRESEQSLEAKVGARTAELVEANDRLRTEAAERQRIEEQLRQAQKMEAIGHLTGGIAHDFNNLLTIVIGNVESLQRNIGAQAPPRIKRWIENAMHGARRAASLTQHLLAFSRRQPLEPKPVDVNRLVSNLSQMLERTLGERIEVQTILGAGAWAVEADPAQLEAAIVNLAVNARDAMPDGGKLTIETANAHLDEAYIASAAELEAGQYVVIAVSDTGCGMSHDVLEHAFEPFFTTKPTGHGTGLGLSQVYGFVKQSGGHVKLYSEAGQGTTVKIYLRRLLGTAEIETAIAAEPDHTGKETILVVEDDPNVREYSAELLRELGYLVVEAEDGATALRHIERLDSVDLLFTDIGLPGMNGRELADEARRRRPQIKVLYTTGYARNAVVHHGRLDPGVQLIPKPFTYAELATKLRAVLDGKG